MRPTSAHMGYMAVLGVVGWAIIIQPAIVPGLVPAVQPAFSGLTLAVVVAVVVGTRSMAFTLLPGTVISIDSGFYVAATLCVGSIASGRLVVVALTVDALIRMLAGPRQRTLRQWTDAGLYAAYFGGVTGALLAGIARIFDADSLAVSSRADQWSVLTHVVSIGAVFIAAHYALQGVRLQLAGQRAGAYVTRLGLPGVIAELSLLPLAAVVVFVFEPKQPLGIVLLGGTYLLIAFGFNRLSRAGAKLRKRVGELETLGSTSARLAACLHIHQLIDAVAVATTNAITSADALSFCRLSGSELNVDSYCPDRRQFRRFNTDCHEGLAAEVIATDAPVIFSGPSARFGTALEQARSWLGVPVRVFGKVEAVLAVEATVANVFDEDDRRLLEGIASQTSVALQNAHHYELAMVDGLTGLFVRRYFDSRLDEEIERSRRFDTRFAIVMIDIDDFKGLNDGWGHAVGDEALREVAIVLRDEMRGIDTAARYGGEEFALVLPRTGLTEAYTQAERIRQRVSEIAIDAPGATSPIQFTASFGIASYPESGGADSDELLRRADRALYRAKATGKNRVELFWSEESRPRESTLKPI